MAQYMTQRRQRRRQELVILLGGTCTRCGKTENLEFDHIDSAIRSFRLNGKNLDKPWSVLLAEVVKCQLLCRLHHQEKTIESGEIKIVDHGGGLTGKRNCSCELCKSKKKEYMHAYGHPSRVA